MKSVFDRDFWKLDNLRQTWEYKTIALMLRGFVALMVVLYLLFTLSSIYEWGEREWARMQPPEYFKVLLDRGQQSGNFNSALRWLGFQDDAKSDYYVGVIEERSSELPAAFFGYGVRHFTRIEDTENMLFWTMLLRYRLRYDILRCGDPALIDKMANLFDTLYLAYKIDISALVELDKDKPRLKKILQRVLDFDAKNPARNDPRMTCDSLKGMSQLNPTPLPKNEWADVRHTLRIVTETSIKRMDAPTP